MCSSDLPFSPLPLLSPSPFSRPLVSPSSQLINEFRRAWSFIWVITAQASGATPRLQGRGEINILSGSSLSPRAPSIKSNLSQARGAALLGARAGAAVGRGRQGAGLAASGSKGALWGRGPGLQLVGKPESPEERGGKIREGEGERRKTDAFGG